MYQKENRTDLPGQKQVRITLRRPTVLLMALTSGFISYNEHWCKNIKQTWLLNDLQSAEAQKPTFEEVFLVQLVEERVH